jgi:outer membrane protein
MRGIQYLLAVMGCMLCVSARADECDSKLAECATVGQWDFSLAIGYGERTNPIANGSRHTLNILPQWSYYGERFFLENLTLGYTLKENSRQQLNVVLLPSFDQVGFESAGIGNLFIEEGSGNFMAISSDESTEVLESADDAYAFIETETAAQRGENNVTNEPLTFRIEREDLSSRSTAIYTGIEYSHFWESLGLSAMALSDIVDAHGGHEIRLAASWQKSWSRQSIKFASGLNWQSAEVVDHYYGVRDSDTNIAALYYQAGADISKFARFDWRYRLNRKWQLQATVYNKWLGEEVSNSPIVTDETVTTWFIGGVYHF